MPPSYVDARVSDGGHSAKVIAASRSAGVSDVRSGTSLSSSSHLAGVVGSTALNPATLPPGRGKLATKPLPTGSETFPKMMGMVRVCCILGGGCVLRKNEAWLQRDEFLCESLHRLHVGRPQRMSIRILPSVHPSFWSPPWNAATQVCPSRSFSAYAISTPIGRIRSGCCARRERHRRRAADERNELPPYHSITSSARRISMGGTTMPRAWAVRRLMLSRNRVGCSTGKSAGAAPLRILSTSFGRARCEFRQVVRQSAVSDGDH